MPPREAAAAGCPEKTNGEIHDDVHSGSAAHGIVVRIEISGVKHLVPLLSAKSTRYFQNKGKVTDKRSVPDNDTRLKALDLSFKLRGTYTPADPAAQYGVKVIVVDGPRPRHDLVIPDSRPGDPLPVIPPLLTNGNTPRE